jgi:hypothetical protein
MENFEEIYYRDCPHFTIGRVDQWSERGFLLYEGKVYSYEEDRKEQTSDVYAPRTIGEFYELAEKMQIEIPADFLEKLKEAGGGDRSEDVGD